ncbi:OmpA family protein [Wandonia haliotis]|uniref:OmpA family protein n=2 Tax=Wandonia haliotis TaxID=574963 RepID=A0ABN1MQW7_9FLAO
MGFLVSTMKTQLFVLLLFVVSFATVNGQYTQEEMQRILSKSSPGELLRENSQLLLVANYYQSIQVIDRLLEMEPDNANYNYRKGYALLFSQSQYEQALPYLEKAVKNVKKLYDASSEKETAAPVDVYYYLGKCYHQNETLDKATEFYQKYLESSTSKNALYPWAELGITQVENAQKELKNPKNYELKNLGAVINTEAPEFSPVVSLDGSALFFTARRLWKNGLNKDMKDLNTNHYWEDIYVSYKNLNNTWSDPALLEFCQSGQNEATVSVSMDERKIYVYNDVSGNGDIYFSEFKGNQFQQIQAADIKKLNSKFWEPHLTVTPDGQTMLFVSDRAGGYGGRDIYRMVKLPDGNWSEPVNLGPEVNSEFDEDAPFLAMDNKTLYFASNGTKSMGGFDIFMSVQDENGNWSPAINMGVPLNSTGDDIFYTTTMDGTTGYLTSFRNGGFGEKDIYEVKNNETGKQGISVLKGEIVVAGNRPLPQDLSVTVSCLNCGNKTSVTLYPRVRDGVYFSRLEKCREYELVYAYGENETEFYKEKITTKCDTEFEEIHSRALLRLDDMTIIPFMKYHLKGNISDFADQTPVGKATVEFLSVDGELLEKHSTSSEGLFTSALLDSSFFGDPIHFMVKVSKDGYLTQQFEVNETLGEKAVIDLAYLIDKPDVGKELSKVLKLNPIYFDLDKSTIRQDAKVELDKIVQIMNDNPSVRIELGSHTDCRGSANYNLALSERRAKASADYIRKKISDPSRISGKGYGESKLVNNCPCEDEVVSECSEEEHQANRRTEFRIIE